MGARRGSSPSSSDWSNAAGGVFAGRQGEEETGNWVSESQDPSSSRAWSARRSRSTYQEARCSRSPVTKVAMSVQGSPAQEARGDELLDGQSVSVVADGEGPGDSGRVLALRDDRVGEGRHAGGGQRGQFAHLVHGHTLADVGLYLAGAHLPVRLGGVGGLAVAAERRAQGVRDGQNVPVAFRVIERKLFAVGLEPEKLEFFHGSPR